jgi:hypothetical protein
MTKKSTPSVYIIQDLIRPCFSICQAEIALNPGNEMVLKGAFDDLMEEVGGEKFMYVCTGKVVRERL